MAAKSIKKNYIFNLAYQMLLIITPLITAPYLCRVLGADGVGIVSLADNHVSYFTIFAALGVATYGQREISFVQNDPKKRSIVFWNAKLMEWVFSTIALITYIIFVFFERDPKLALIMGFNILAVFADVTWFFQGMEEFGRIVGRNVIFKLLGIIYIFVFVRDAEDILIYAFGLAGFLFLSNLSLWFMLPSFLVKVSLRELKPFKDIAVCLSLFLPTVAIMIYTALDKTMIGIITHDDYQNGYYEQAMKISKIVLTIVTSLGTVMVPRIGHFFSDGEMDKVKELMYRSFRFVWFLGLPLAVGLICTAPNLIPWFLGDDFNESIILLQVLSALIVIIGLSNVIGIQYLVPTKRQSYLTISVVIGACVNFVLNIVLILRYASLGAAIASVAAETVVTIVQLILVRKELSVGRILAQGVKYYIAVALMAAALIPMMLLLSPSILHTLMMVFVGVLIYIGVLLIMRDEFLIENVKLLYSKYTRK